MMDILVKKDEVSMELWIRSQDKTRLTKIEDLYLVHDDNNFCDYIGNNIVGHLAKYTKQGRALEVLDEIQNILFYKKMSEDNMSTFAKIITDKYGENVRNKLYMNTAVYEMPKE